MATRFGDALDLDAYFLRTGYRGAREATLEALHELHFAHATSIPFENLDVLLSRPILLDPASLQNKLVGERRGGYCFEQNLLFARVLESLGFSVTMLAARVRWMSHRLLPRTHMLLAVDVSDQRWIADVGFGGQGLLLPLMLEEKEQVARHTSYRLVREAGGWTLRSLGPAGWIDLYHFTLEPQEPVDYEVASYYVSSHPESIFRKMLTVQLATGDGRWILKDDQLLREENGATRTQTISTPEERVDVLSRVFGLELADAANLPWWPRTATES